jgi:hypothetical protein
MIAPPHALHEPDGRAALLRSRPSIDAAVQAVQQHRPTSDGFMDRKHGSKTKGASHEPVLRRAGDPARSTSEPPGLVSVPDAPEGPTRCGRGRPRAICQWFMATMREESCFEALHEPGRDGTFQKRSLKVALRIAATVLAVSAGLLSSTRADDGRILLRTLGADTLLQVQGDVDEGTATPITTRCSTRLRSAHSRRTFPMAGLGMPRARLKSCNLPRG